MADFNVWDKLDKLEVAWGAYGTLEALAKALDPEMLEERLDYIVRCYDIDLDDY